MKKYNVIAAIALIFMYVSLNAVNVILENNYSKPIKYREKRSRQWSKETPTLGSNSRALLKDVFYLQDLTIWSEEYTSLREASLLKQLNEIKNEASLHKNEDAVITVNSSGIIWEPIIYWEKAGEANVQ